MPEQLDIAVELARQAGELMRKNFTLGMRKEWKEDSTPLTATDKAINDFVVAALRERYPTHGIIAEEGSDYDGQEACWICDPIDGTLCFSTGMPTSTFLLAFVEHGQAQLAVVYDPYMERLFTAERGKGAFLNGERITMRPPSQLRSQSIAFCGRKVVALTTALQRSVDEGMFLTNIPSAGYLFALVAAGELVGCVMHGGNLWDVAAPSLIIEEAGGRFTDLRGEPYTFPCETFGAIAATPELHAQLVKWVEPDR